MTSTHTRPLPHVRLVLLALALLLSLLSVLQLVQGQAQGQVPYTMLPTPGGAPPLGAVTNAAGTQLYVGVTGSVLHYSLASNGSFALNRTLSTATSFPYGLALNSTTSSLFVADYNGLNSLIRFDANTGAVLLNLTLNLLHRSRDGAAWMR